MAFSCVSFILYTVTLKNSTCLCPLLLLAVRLVVLLCRSTGLGFNFLSHDPFPPVLLWARCLFIEPPLSVKHPIGC